MVIGIEGVASGMPTPVREDSTRWRQRAGLLLVAGRGFVHCFTLVRHMQDQVNTAGCHPMLGNRPHSHPARIPTPEGQRR